MHGTRVCIKSLHILISEFVICLFVCLYCFRDRGRIYRGLAATLAQLHSLDPAELGLQGFGNPQHYCRWVNSPCFSTVVNGCKFTKDVCCHAGFN
jgi:hypothetical protein